MRPAGKGELDSLYFTYPQFDAPPRARIQAATEVPVAIIGAGPVGMFAALTLARFGVRSVLIDRKATFNDGSRAICVQRSSFQALERAGAVAPFLETALGWTTGRSFYRGQQILEFRMPAPESEKYLPMYNIQQQYVEAYLWQAVAASDLIDARWQTEIAGLSDAEDGVQLTLSDPNGAYDLRAGWVLAADGARSAVRRMRGLRLAGENYEGRYVIADVRMAHEYPTIRRALFDSPSNLGKTILIHRQPGDIWRIDYQLPDGQDPDEAIREDEIRANVSAILTDIGHTGPWELEWWSIYSANTLALDDYRDGRVLFIGDSAHIVPIFGVRGLNNGLADAENAGWKLARVIRGQSGEALLDSYTPERRGATLDVFANASKSARFMTPPTRGWQVMRDAALSLALDHPFAGEFANPRQMEPFTYAGGGAVLPSDPGAPVPVGAVLPDAKLGQGYLSDRLGNGFTLLWLGAAPDGTPLPGRDIAEVGGIEIGAAFGTDGALLIRPDGYVCGYWRRPDRARIAAAFDAVFGPGEG